MLCVKKISLTYIQDDELYTDKILVSGENHIYNDVTLESLLQRLA